MHADVAAAKRALRERMRRRRLASATVAASAQAHLEVLARQLLAALAPRAVFCYLSTAEEVATSVLIDALLATGHTVAVPALVDRTTMLATRFPGWDMLEPGRLGILAPRHAVACEDTIDCVLVPGLAFSPRGARLGYGAGYYDRWLAAHPAATRIGLCFEYQIEPATPSEAHDEALDFLVTERRIVALPARR